MSIGRSRIIWHEAYFAKNSIDKHQKRIRPSTSSFLSSAESIESFVLMDHNKTHQSTIADGPINNYSLISDKQLDRYCVNSSGLQSILNGKCLQAVSFVTTHRWIVTKNKTPLLIRERFVDMTAVCSVQKKRNVCNVVLGPNFMVFLIKYTTVTQLNNYVLTL